METLAHELDNAHSGTPPRVSPTILESSIRPMTLSELQKLASTGTDWLVDDMLPASGTSIVVAKPKVGKSTLVRVLAVAVSQGAPFLGRVTQQVPVLYLALEENAGEVGQHFASLGANDTDLHIHVGPTGQHPFDQLRQHVAEIQPGLVIVDTLFRFVSVADGNSYAAVTRALEPFYEIAQRNACHVMLVHHAGKVERDGGDSILGSTAIFGAVDTAMMLSCRAERRTVQTIQRYGTNLPETALTLDAETRAITLGNDLASEKQDALHDELRLVIGGRWLTATEIKGAMNKPGGIVNKAISEMLKSGALIQQGIGKKGDPYRYGIASEPMDSGMVGEPLERVPETDEESPDETEDWSDMPYQRFSAREIWGIADQPPA